MMTKSFVEGIFGQVNYILITRGKQLYITGDYIGVQDLVQLIILQLTQR